MQEERRRRTWEAPSAPGSGTYRRKVYSYLGTQGETRTRNDAGTYALMRKARQGGGGLLLQGKPAVCGWGVVSSVVLGAWESHVHGEGLDGSTQPAKETHPGHVGPEAYEPTSLRAIAIRAWTGNGSALRGSECDRGTG
jgi:hypothetical protein